MAEHNSQVIETKAQPTERPWRWTPCEVEDGEPVSGAQLYHGEQPVWTVDCGDYMGLSDVDAAFIVRAVNAHDELVASLKETRDACAAAMRVVADLDAMHMIGASAATREQRFADELKVSGIANGFGVRATKAIAKAEGTA